MFLPRENINTHVYTRRKNIPANIILACVGEYARGACRHGIYCLKARKPFSVSQGCVCGLDVAIIPHEPARRYVRLHYHAYGRSARCVTHTESSGRAGRLRSHFRALFLCTAARLRPAARCTRDAAVKHFRPFFSRETRARARAGTAERGKQRDYGVKARFSL